MSSRTTRVWRWIALGSVVANVAFNYLSQSVLPIGEDSRVLTDRYDPLFMPATYAFSIWGLIYAGFTAYAVYALMPSQRAVKLHDCLSRPLTVANLLASTWIILFQVNYVGSSMFAMMAIVAMAAVLYGRSRDASLNERAYAPSSRLVGVPFSLFLGWIGVAFIANMATWFRYIGMEANPPLATGWAATLLVLAAAFGIGMAVRYRDGVVPGVVSWAAFAVFVEAHGENVWVSGFALGMGIATGLAAVGYLLRSAAAMFERHKENERRSVALVVTHRRPY
jgi:hypothetical protein